jgi:hypothetical protein
LFRSLSFPSPRKCIKLSESNFQQSCNVIHVNYKSFWSYTYDFKVSENNIHYIKFHFEILKIFLNVGDKFQKMCFNCPFFVWEVWIMLTYCWTSKNICFLVQLVQFSFVSFLECFLLKKKTSKAFFKLQCVGVDKFKLLQRTSLNNWKHCWAVPNRTPNRN